MALKKRQKNLYDLASVKPFKLSRSKLENFLRCSRCFYLDRRLGIGQPSSPAFTLNSAVDALLKKEFDLYRAKREPHPLMREHGIDAIPFDHPDLSVWRENFKGMQVHHKPTNLIITGAIDDLWQTSAGQIIVVDYKATSTNNEITLDDQWKISYKRQMEIYQWILKGLGFDVAAVGYFVYANGRKDLDGFNATLNFHLQVIPHRGDSSWVEGAIFDAHACLNEDQPPPCGEACEYCHYRALVREVE